MLGILSIPAGGSKKKKSKFKRSNGRTAAIQGINKAKLAYQWACPNTHDYSLGHLKTYALNRKFTFNDAKLSPV